MFAGVIYRDNGYHSHMTILGVSDKSPTYSHVGMKDDRRGQGLHGLNN